MRQGAAAADESGPIRLVLRRDADPAAPAQHVNHVDAVATRARAACADNRVALRHTPRFDEEITERRVCEIRVVWRQNDFRITGQVEAASAGAVVCDRHAPQLRIVFRRDDHLGPGLNPRVDAAEDRAIGRKDHIVLVWRARCRLVCRGPDVAAVEIAHVAEAAPAVGCDVLAPPSHGDLLTPAVATAGVGDHHGVRSVRQQMGPRTESVGGCVAAQRRRGRARRREVIRHLHGRIAERHQTREALLEQEVGCLDARVGMKPLPQRGVMQRVVERGERHALVVCHVGGQNHTGFPIRRIPFECVIDRFVEAVPADHAFPFETLKIAQDVERDKRRHQHGRVGRHDQIVGEPAFQPEPGDAKRPILIIALEILHVVRRFGDAPRHAPLQAVLHLSLDDGPVGLVEERAGICPHDQQRHEVLEHRGAPGEQRARGTGRRHGPSQFEPVLVGDLTGGDSDKTGEAGLGRQCVVVGAIQPPVGDAEANGEELPLAVEEKAELGFLDEVVGQLRQPDGAIDELLRICARSIDGGSQFGCVSAPLERRRRPGAPRNQRGQSRGRAWTGQPDLRFFDRRGPRCQELEISLTLRDRDACALQPHGCFRGVSRGFGVSLGFIEFIQQHAESRDPIRELIEKLRPAAE